MIIVGAHLALGSTIAHAVLEVRAEQ